ncbi:glycosyltransferase [Gilliamella sp. B2838]|uniref:glycosyltransferase n=1 Tax=Gilliamella sp. B2838 TaxID=2818020 RepID=UPI002269889C|nr:glycosyltransferase [Gilliamella sp. B2838]MCX8726406.1 glycosyltransferase [Gilliamella sp. B2838]
MHINKLPLVSVVISSYNHENYVQETIKSIISQIYENIELIIIDDGSTDSTYEKILEMESLCKKRFVNVFFQKQENQGVGSTCNKLINLSSGDYIYHIASDDLAKPDAINDEVLFLKENNEYALVVGNNEIIDNNGNVAYWDELRNITYNEDIACYKTFADFLRIKQLKNNFGTYLYLYNGNHIPNGYLVRKSIYAKTGLYNKNAPLEDWFMNLQIAKYAKIKYLDKILFSYRWHQNNTIKQTKKIQSMYDLTFKYENNLLGRTDFNNVNKDVVNCFLYGKLKKRFVIISNIFEIRKYKKYGMKMSVLHFLNFDFIFNKKFIHY